MGTWHRYPLARGVYSTRTRREVGCTDRKEFFDDEIVKLFQRRVIRLGEARLQLLGGVSLVELERNHCELKPAKQPQKRLSGLMDPLFGFGLQHSLKGFGIDRVGSKPCTNLLDISVQVRLDSRKGCRAEDICRMATKDERRVAVEDRNGAPNIFTTPPEAWRNSSVSTPPSIGTSANDCRSDQLTSPSTLPQAAEWIWTVPL